MKSTCIQILLPVLMIITLPKLYSQNNSVNQKATGLKKVEFNIFKTDFGYGEQSINFKNWQLCNQYFHYKIFGYGGLKWREMKIEERPDQHYYLSVSSSRFHIVFMNFDKKSSKLFFTIGKPPHYFYTGNVMIKPKVESEYLDYFSISAAYTLSVPVDGYHNIEYMAVFYTFMIPNNTHLESNILLVCKTPDDKF